MMNDLETTKQLNQKITLKDALYFMEEAWNDVSVKNIKKFWNHTRLIPAEKEKVEFFDENEEDIGFIGNAVKKLNIENCCHVDKFINMNIDLVKFEELEKNEIA